MVKKIEDLIIIKDIFAITGQRIARQGDNLNEELLKKIASSGKIFSDSHLFVCEVPLFKDFSYVINERIYRNVFDSSTVKNAVLDIIGKMSFHPIIYDELEWMRIFDSHTYHHVLVTTALVTRLAMDFFENSEKVSLVSSTALIHDFGKSRIPLQILHKTGILTSDESSYIQEHVVIGFILLTYYLGDYKALACKVALEHHERLDGTGYPRGIRETNKIVELITPCDVFDALTSHRPYMDSPFDRRGALDQLLEEAESGRLNKDVVVLLLSYNRKDKPPLDSIVISKKKRGFIPEKNYYGQVEERSSFVSSNTSHKLNPKL